MLGTHKEVVTGFSAALINAGGRVALVSVRSNGAIGSATNVVNGATFPAIPGGLLPCDLGGRCMVIALESDGTAVVSAYTLGADGQWSAAGDAVSSATSAAVSLDLDGDTGFAVQSSANGLTVWTVYAWKEDGFTPVGCSPNGKQPDVAVMSLDTCLS